MKISIVRIWRAFLNSLSGLGFAMKNEAAFFQDFVLVSIVFFSFFFIDVSKFEFIAVLFASALLLITELLNSAIEATVDLVTLEIRPLAKVAKDLASAAVFIALVLLFIIYFIIVFS